MSDLIVAEKPESIYDYDYELPGQQYDYDQQESPLPKGLLFIFSLFLLLKCLVPASKGRYIPFLWGSYIWWSEVLFIGLALIMVCYRLFSGLPRISKDTKHKVLIPILLLGLFQVISMSWNGQGKIEKAYSLIQSVMMCSAVLAVVFFISGRTFADRQRIIFRLTMILIFVILVYMGLSFLFPSLRPSSAYMERTVYTLGFIRVFGPLAPSSTLSFALFPALSYSISMLFVPGKSKLFWITAILIALVGIVGTGSRASILGLMMFVFVFVLVYKIGALKIVLPMAVLFGLVIAAVGIPERFRNFEDIARMETYKTALRAVSSSPQAFIGGVGHGHLYSLLYDNTLRSLHHKDRWYLAKKNSSYGFTLRNSHSSFLQPLAENGVIGFCLFIIMPSLLLWRLFARRYSCIKDVKMQQARITLVGCMAGAVLMPLDVYILSNTWLTFIWLAFAIAAIETISEAYRQTKMERYYEDSGIRPEEELRF